MYITLQPSFLVTLIHPFTQNNKNIYGKAYGLTVLTVSSGGLSLMSVMEIRAVAVLDKPKFKLPSMSVAWTMMVYWDTFCKKH